MKKAPNHEGDNPVGSAISARLRSLIDDQKTATRVARPTIVCPGSCGDRLGWMLEDQGEMVLVTLVRSDPTPHPSTQRCGEFIGVESQAVVYERVS